MLFNDLNFLVLLDLRNSLEIRVNKFFLRLTKNK